MTHILEYFNWTSTSSFTGAQVNTKLADISDDTDDNDIVYNFKSIDKIWYGIHKIRIEYKGKSIYVNAKFDTGARTSSLDTEAAKKLGIESHIIDATKEIEKIPIEKTSDKKRQKEIENSLNKEYIEKYPGVSSVQLIKSASGFSVRLYVRITINYDGRIIQTEVNLKDRSGMKAEMLVGLSNML